MVRLRGSLDRLYRELGPEHLASDPLWFPSHYDTRGDREVMAFIAAVFSYGGVRQIFRSLESISGRLGPHPEKFLRSATRSEIESSFDGFTHRFNTADDLRCLLLTIGAILRRHGTIEAAFAAGFDGDLRASLGAFSRRIRALSLPFRRPGCRSFDYFVPDPASTGSACKRLLMFLRWTVRREPPDLGLWRCLEPSQLLIPLDTHVARISRYLGLLRRRTVDWKAAEEVTSALRLLDPSDPVKYDFSMARLGILRLCTRAPGSTRCGACPLGEACGDSNRRSRRRSRRPGG